MLDCLAVALGGAIGSVLRYLIGLIPLNEKYLFPAKTFAINVLGCFLIGLITALSLRSSNLNPRGERATVQKLSKKFNLLTLNQSNAYMHICVVFKYSYISYKNNFNFLRICVAKENLKK
jgi:CrcB protein